MDCISSGDGSSSRPCLQVTKLDNDAVRLDFPEEGQAYELSYYHSTHGLSSSRWATVEKVAASQTPTATRFIVANAGLVCTPAGGTRRTSYLSDTIWVVRSTRTAGRDDDITVLRRAEAEAVRPQNGDGLDGFDARRFGPSGRRVWMFDTGYSDKEEAAERGRQRMSRRR